nr:Nramp family divalent metal transporter [Maritalea mediterranea]
MWAISSVGSGSILFTPRVGSEYGYEFVWLLWLVCLLMWVMIREAGRFSVVTGRTVLDGFRTLPGPKNWPLWLIFIPQLFAASVGVAGLSGLAGSAIKTILPGGLLLWSNVLLWASVLLVGFGGYKWVSRVAQIFALFMVVVTFLAALQSKPDMAMFVEGVVPGRPQNLNIPFILPWVGTILAGSMGILWYSYWVSTKGYGGAVGELHKGEDVDEVEEQDRAPQDRQTAVNRLQSWMGTMSNTALVGVLIGTLTITSFLVLGVELLKPAGIVPSGVDVALQLTKLLSEIWGSLGYWIMMMAIIVILGGSVIANQDGWSRSFADITLLIPLKPYEQGGDAQAKYKETPRWMKPMVFWRPPSMTCRQALKIFYLVGVTGITSTMLILMIGDPVKIMSFSGIIAAVHTPFIVFTTFALNLKLPEEVRPNGVFNFLMLAAGLFYGVFMVLYVLNFLSGSM